MSWFDAPKPPSRLEMAIVYIKRLEAAVASQEREIDDLRSQLRDGLQKLVRACDDLDKSWLGESEAVRRRVLRHQALRARLGKRNMSPHARLRTLKAAKAAGMKLTDEQHDELRDLESTIDR